MAMAHILMLLGLTLLVAAEPTLAQNSKSLAKCRGGTLDGWMQCLRDERAATHYKQQQLKQAEAPRSSADESTPSENENGTISLYPLLFSALGGLFFRRRRKNAPDVEETADDDTECLFLCAPLGLAIATFIAKVLKSGNGLVEDEISEMLEADIQEALSPVLGTQCKEFAGSLKKSFVTYFKIMSKDLPFRRRMTSTCSVQTCTSPEKKYPSDSKLLQIENSRKIKVCKVEDDDATSVNQEITEQSFEVQDVTLSRRFEDLSIHGGDSQPSGSLQEKSCLTSSTLPYAVGTAAAATNMSQAFLDVFERQVEAQEKLNHLKLIGLLERAADRSRRMELKEEEVTLAMKTTALMQENNDLTRSKFEFEVSGAENEAISAGCATFSKRCADDFMAGMLVMVACMGYGTWKQSPMWIADICSSCQPSLKEKPSYSWQYMSWSLSAAEEIGKSSICLFKGTLGVLTGLFAFYFLTSFLLRKIVSNSRESIPATALIIVGGGMLGYAGKMTVNLLGGDGFTWLILWELLCCSHAISNYYTRSLYSVFDGRDRNRNRNRGFGKFIAEVCFHVVLGFALPATVSLAAFPVTWPLLGSE